MFHDPDSLSDGELEQMRQKLTFQRYLPYYSAATAGFAFHVMSAQMFRTGLIPARIAAAAAAGYVVGGYGAHYASGSTLKKRIDSDIMRAFEERFLRHRLNVAGYGDNAVTYRHNADMQGQIKPY